MFSHQVIVIGGGLTGLRAAIEARKTADVAIISKVHPLRSHSGAAQGGANAALGNHPEAKDDNPEKHAFDTVKGADFLADQDAAEIMAQEAPIRMLEMDRWGMPFSRTEEGKIAQRPFGGAGYPRTCYSADKTGLHMLHNLYERSVREGIKRYDEWQVTSLVVKDGTCRGIIAIHLLTGELAAFKANAVIFATGGAGRVFQKTTNAIINTGSGMAVAYWAGLPLEDMEFTQFHPTTLIGTNILVTEAARGEGGYLYNKAGERFMRNYTPKFMELAPRDIVSRSIQTEINEGRGVEDRYVLLDLRHLGAAKINERLPGIRDLCIHFSGIDPIDSPIPIEPGMHYTMGGIACENDGATSASGVYAAGECGCVSVHGANRLGGNSLLETVVFGKIAGEAAALYVKGKGEAPGADKTLQEALKRDEDRIQRLLKGDGSESPALIREEMKAVMTEKVAIFRTQKPMEEALEKVKELKSRYKKAKLLFGGRKYNLDLARTLELGGKLDLAEIIVAGALARQESRGSHSRLEFPERDDNNWLKHTMVHWTEKGPRFSYKEVRITKYIPEARKY